MQLIEGNQVLQCTHARWDVIQTRKILIDTILKNSIEGSEMEKVVISVP